MIRSSLAVLTACLALLPGFALAEGQAEKLTVYKGASLIDGTGAPPRPGMSILVKGERIERVWKDGEIAFKLPPQTVVVDMAGQYALPGLIDSHEHLATPPNRPFAQAHLRRDLYSGVTAIRDMADDLRNVADLARATRIGEIPGPDIYYAALMAGPSFFEDERVQAASLGAKGGEVSWMQAITPQTDLPLAVAQARGIGASAIKIYANLSGEEVARITAEAHRQGVPIWAHAAVFPATPAQVLDAGADVVSHVCMLAYQVSDQIPGQYHKRAAVQEEKFGTSVHPEIAKLLAKMKADGVVLDATVRIYEAMKGRPTKPYCSTELAAQITNQALQAGVIISAGTDGFSAPDAPFPALYEELELLVNRAGFTPMQAIVAATRNGALSVRKDPDFGTIEAGKLANLVFTRQDPSKDIGALRSLTLTVKRGQAYPRTDYDPKADAAVRKED
ncbi:MAG: amidohydrolase family protein [Phenylobacterium sp.]|uniref:amidohydrolase family protein n=1 Tax=Phenylobacterium sp. TaxID=1871053 RepID=UPI00271C1109|nr:amidohydrolase family protein [Phenylobacterium sp.]MDO9430291.1 amidohydrolase family protein [Phenylobacterium sp.]